MRRIHMKKRNRCLSIALVAMASVLASCSTDDYTYPDANWKDHVIVEVGGKTYKYDEIYALMNGKKDSAQAYYSTAKNVLAQLVTDITESMRSEVASEMDELRTTWKNNSKANQTSYKEEQEKTFESEKVDNEEELIAKKLASKQNTQNEKDFYSENDGVSDPKESYFISEERTKKFVEETAPYHVSHILAKVDASSDGTGYWKGEISSDNAKKIGNIVRMLSTGTSFGDTAQITSDDGSKANFGELASSDAGQEQIAMLKSTSYVNEFKLGVYAYDAFINPDVSEADRAKALESLRVPTVVESSSVHEDIDDTILGQGKAIGIPLSKAFKMAFAADTTHKLDGTDILNSTATSYPRNIIFNNYFNSHAVSFIYDDSASYDADFVEECKNYVKGLKNADSTTPDELVNASNSWTTPADIAAVPEMADKYEEYEYVKDILNSIDSSRFTTISDSLEFVKSGSEYGTSIGTGLKVLHDENAHPIIVTRAGTSDYQGVHFIIVHNDPFTADANGTTADKYKYYRVNMPSQTSTDAATSQDYKAHPSFVNFIKTDKGTNSTYTNRINAVEAVIRSSDSHSEYLLWEKNIAAFKAKYNIEFSTVIGQEVYDAITELIDTTRTSSDRSANDSLDSSWETYINQLGVQAQYAKRTLPGVCSAFFEAGDIEGEGGMCHVKK